MYKAQYPYKINVLHEMYQTDLFVSQSVMTSRQLKMQTALPKAGL